MQGPAQSFLAGISSERRAYILFFAIGQQRTVGRLGDTPVCFGFALFVFWCAFIVEVADMVASVYFFSVGELDFVFRAGDFGELAFFVVFADGREFFGGLDRV